MTLSNVWKKLRNSNKKEYKQFEFCLTLSVLLIVSYLMMLRSPLVQNTFPIGGDSRKMIMMIFGIAAAGCIMFSVYATGLFLRYKSREIGVFLALGAPKLKLAKALFIEVGKIVLGCFLVGIAGGTLISFIIGKIFEGIVSKGDGYYFAITITGIGYSLLYCTALIFCIGIMTVRFMKRSNIMDIISEQRKQEPILKLVTTRYLISGIVCIVVGIFMGFVFPGVVVALFNHWVGPWINLFYILVAIGLYRIMVYSIAFHKKGKNPQKYYQNLISYGMLKFQGASIVRNMFVITLLIMGSLFAMFYQPLQQNGMKDVLEQYETSYSYRYPSNADEVTENDVKALANKHNLDLINYREASFIQVVGSGIDNGQLDKNGNLIETYYEDYLAYECISESEFERISGKKITILDGHYRMIQLKDASENVWYKFGEMDKLYCESKDTYLSMKYDGLSEYTSLVLGNGFENKARFIISDHDYETLKTGLADSQIIRQVLFDTTDGEGEYAFGKELFEAYANRTSDNMNYASDYDVCEEKRGGDDYYFANGNGVIYDAKRSELETDWKYEPMFVPLQMKNMFMTYAIFYLAYIYVAIICLAAVGVIGYTRSQSVGTRNRQVFADIEKLGGDHSYLHNLLKKQIQKVYVLPAVIGCVLMFGFELLLLWQNDGKLVAYEMKLLVVSVLLAVCVVIYQYLMYRISLKTVAKTLGLEV